MTEKFRRTKIMMNAKQQESEQKRKAALLERKRLARERDRQTCSVTQNKRIKFDGSSSEEEETNKVVGGEKLFESEESGGEEVLEKQFKKDQYEGKAGRKLFELESRFGGDNRFKMGAKFLPEFEGHEEPAVEPKNEETNKNLTILGKVLGKDVRKEDGKKKGQQIDGKTSCLPNFTTRFDPRNPAHYRYETGRDAANSVPDGVACTFEISDKKAKNGGESEGKLIKSLEGQFSEMKQEFAEKLKKKVRENGKNEKPFSLLESLGKTELLLETSKPNAVKEMPTEMKHFAANLKPWQRKLTEVGRKGRGDDSSSDESYSNPAPRPTNAHKSSPTTQKSGQSHGKFFLSADDEKLEKALSKFKRNDSAENVKKKWQVYRPSLVKIYKKQRKDALRKQRNQAKLQDNKRSL